MILENQILDNFEVKQCKYNRITKICIDYENLIVCPDSVVIIMTLAICPGPVSHLNKVSYNLKSSLIVCLAGGS